MRRFPLYGLALVAVAFLVLAALRGERPNSALVAYVDKGFLADQPADFVREVMIERAGRRWVYRRGPAATPVEGLETAMALLRGAAPERHIALAEMSGERSEYGLDPPSLTVALLGADAAWFRIAFGGPNPLGLSRYARIEGQDGIWLVPGHLPQAWEALAR